jgi:serine/threonine-protein kinase
VDTSVRDPLVGRLLDGRYRVGPKIARGGMATVYEATDLRLDRRVALKVLPHALADDEAFSQRFVREARAAARLTHPNVVAVYDQGDDDGTLFLAMEYVDGGTTLRDVIRDEAPLPPPRALALLEQILQALAAAHESGIIHRDIKPENVLINPRGQLKVADFGLARAITSATSATATGGVIMGTVSYLPPELVVDGTADARSDVYAVGVLLFELLTGTKPHGGDSPIQVAYKHVHEDVPAPSSVVPGIPPYLDAFVARATARQRDLRPADAHVMLRQLRRVRNALDSGVLDDAELTDDLTPTVAIALDTGPLEAAFGDRPEVDEVFDVERYDDQHTVRVGQPAGLVRSGGNGTVEVAPQPHEGAPTEPHPPARTRRRRGGLVALVLVLLLAAGAALAGWWYGMGRYQSTPEVVGLTQQVARQHVKRAGLDFEVASSAYSETVPKGHVISTDPGPGDDVLRDGTVEVTVSRGPERHDVPDLRRMSESKAVTAVQEASLTLAPIERRWSETVPKGTVIEFSPKAGTPLRRDDEVTIVVSKGPQPIEIDNFEGTAADNAVQTLEQAGFDVTVDERYHDRVPDGDVIRQSPDHGTGHRDDRIRLAVSLGPHLVEVPDVFHYGVADAKAALSDAGFEVDVQENSVSFGLGFVVVQDPDGGSMAPYGSTVTLTVV